MEGIVIVVAVTFVNLNSLSVAIRNVNGTLVVAERNLG